MKIEDAKFYDSIMYTIDEILKQGKKNPTVELIADTLDVEIQKAKKAIEYLQGKGYLITKNHSNHYWFSDNGTNFILTNDSFGTIIKKQSEDATLRRKQEDFFTSSTRKNNASLLFSFLALIISIIHIALNFFS